MTHTDERQGFRSLPLSPKLLETLDRLGFTTPTPIQQAAIGPAIEGRDLIGIAQTGTGKTLAFGLPIAERLKAGQSALVLAPTRELAIQIQEVFDALGLQTALLIGGANMAKQIAQLRKNPAVVVATPGRLIDHIGQRTVRLDSTAICVLDEADRMLDMGFAPSVRRILDKLPHKRQTMLFSATMPSEIAELADQYLTDPIEVEVERAGTAAANVIQELLLVHQENKANMLEQLLLEHPGSVLAFTRTRHGARKLAKAVHRLGHAATEIHADKTLVQRRAALDGFKAGRYRVLIATDIAARGIDVKDISLVINYDIPEKPEDYVHRIGRTGRAGASGRAITLATPAQHKEIRNIERLLRKELALSRHSLKPGPKGVVVLNTPKWHTSADRPHETHPKRLFAR